MPGYQDLKVWQISHQLTLDIYRITESFPKSEVFGIISQLRRAAYSVPSNIVEGKSRDTDKEFRRFLIIARASCDEVSYFLLLSKDLNFISEDLYKTHVETCQHIASMLNNLIKRLN